MKGLGLAWVREDEGKEDSPVSPRSELDPLGFVHAESCIQEGSPSGDLDGCVEMRSLCLWRRSLGPADQPGSRENGIIVD